MPSELSLVYQISGELYEDWDCTLARYVLPNPHCLIACAYMQKEDGKPKLVRVYTAVYGRSAPAAGLQQVRQLDHKSMLNILITLQLFA